MTEDILTWAVVIIILIAGVWLTILTYIVLAAKRRSHSELVEEIKRTLKAEQESAKIVPLLNEMLETESTHETKAKIKTIRKKAKKIDVSDIANLMEELDTLIVDSMHEMEEREAMGKDLDDRLENVDAPVEESATEAPVEPTPEAPEAPTVAEPAPETPPAPTPDTPPAPEAPPAPEPETPVATEPAPPAEPPQKEESLAEEKPAAPEVEVDCIMCGSPIPAGDKKCPGCGTMKPK